MAQWVTIATATDLLQKSDRTIRRWIEGGKLPSQRQPDNSLLVDISGFEIPTVDTKDINAMRARLDLLEAQNALLTSERDFLRSALAAAMDTQRALIEAQVSKDDNRQGKDSDEAEPSIDKGKWWKFW